MFRTKQQYVLAVMVSFKVALKKECRHTVSLSWGSNFKKSIKVLLRSNYRYSFFYIFVYNMTFFHILPNFSPLRTLEVRIRENDVIFATSRVDIIITISIENRIKSNTNFGHVLRAYCYYNVNP